MYLLAGYFPSARIYQAPSVTLDRPKTPLLRRPAETRPTVLAINVKGWPVPNFQPTIQLSTKSRRKGNRIFKGCESSLRRSHPTRLLCHAHPFDLPSLVAEGRSYVQTVPEEGHPRSQHRTPPFLEILSTQARSPQESSD